MCFVIEMQLILRLLCALKLKLGIGNNADGINSPGKTALVKNSPTKKGPT